MKRQLAALLLTIFALSLTACGDVGKYRLSTTPISEKCAFSREFSLPAMPCFRGFRPLFTRSIKAQTSYNLSS